MWMKILSLRGMITTLTILAAIVVMMTTLTILTTEIYEQLSQKFDNIAGAYGGVQSSLQALLPCKD